MPSVPRFPWCSLCPLWLVVLVAFVAPVRAQTLRERILAAEDARVTADADLAPILTGLKQRETSLVAISVRALGRFERPALVKHIVPFLTHARSEVRAEAANALGQAFAALPRGEDAANRVDPPELATVTRTLIARLRAEPDPYVTGVVAESVGRLPYRTAAQFAEAETAIGALLPVAAGAAPVIAGSEAVARVVHPASLTGAVKGLETLVRVNQKLHSPDATTRARLRAAATLEADPSDADFASIRRVAWLAIHAAAAADVALIARGLDDTDAQVRRIAVLTLGNLESAGEARLALLRRAVEDHSPIVRYDAVRVYSRTMQALDCSPLIKALDDPNAHVALAAIDALGNGCPEGPNVADRLMALSDELPNPGNAPNDPNPRTSERVAWHRPAHAFVSLARVAREQAASRLATFAEHPLWQVRMYAARAAAALVAGARLERLAADAHDNVREAALTGLLVVRRHDADALYIDALGRPDYQLVLTAARALEGSPNGDKAVPALVAAFRRLTAEQRDTSRDPRVAILERLRELGGREHASLLQTCVADVDVAVAAECAATLREWTGIPPVVRPAARPKPAVAASPSASAVRVTMRGGRRFELRLFPEDAPATVARFVRLAKAGYYNGLTFHRVVPNFVLQGGSPGANEYMGDGPFMRDEIGLRTHARGTLGISTRGRDTGDAQIFINLLDNPRLDHNFTVFAEVSSGLDVVDGILEGDVIERIDVLGTTSS